MAKGAEEEERKRAEEWREVGQGDRDGGEEDERRAREVGEEGEGRRRRGQARVVKEKEH